MDLRMRIKCRQFFTSLPAWVKFQKNKTPKQEDWNEHCTKSGHKFVFETQLGEAKENLSEILKQIKVI